MRELLLLGILGVLVAQTSGASAVQQYNCSATSCTCIGTSDCKELLGSGWCVGGKLKCGTDAGLPPDKCKCAVAKVAPKANSVPALKGRPNVKAK